MVSPSRGNLGVCEPLPVKIPHGAERADTHGSLRLRLNTLGFKGPARYETWARLSGMSPLAVFHAYSGSALLVSLPYMKAPTGLSEEGHLSGRGNALRSKPL